MPEVLPQITFDAPAAEVVAGDGEFWQLYDSAFPANEREPRSVILESLSRGVGLTICARREGHTVGLAIAHLLREPAVVFVVYLAVVPELRSQRLGSSLFEEMWMQAAKRYAEQRSAALGMVWEVDIAERAASEQEMQKRRRRIAFFGRLGGRMLAHAYFQPPVDGVTSVPMQLMYRPAPGGLVPEGASIAALVHAMYFEKYHQANKIPTEVLQKLLHKS